MALYFISDLHLDASRPDLAAAFFSYLKNLPEDAEHLYILGDFFEVWIGDDDDDAFHASVIDALKQATDSGACISLLHGNRDFLLGSAFAQMTGTTLLTEPYLLRYGTTPYLLMHGDALCTADTRYMAFRQQVRKPAWQAALLQKPLGERRAIAASLRQDSKRESAAKDEYITDVTQDDVVLQMRQAKVNTLIHGHTHRPAVHHFSVDGEPCTRMVLGDWNHYGFDIRLDENGAKLRRFPITNVQATEIVGEADSIGA